MPGCLTDETVAGLIERTLDPSAIRDVAEHIDACADCRRMVADVLLSLEPSPDSIDPREPQPLQEGAAVGRYQIQECIGAGAMGIVYTARDPDLGRRVALKLLRADPAAASSQDARARLLREAQAMAQLSHANVLTIYDVGTHGDEVFLAMEFLEGGTLGEWLATPRPWREVLSVFRRAGEGLAAAHAAGLVHRDFKPENVLVSQGSEGRICVTDFGLARAAADAPRAGGAPGAHPEGLVATMTRSGTLVGTPAYMAPEQLEGGTADARSDEFSFAVALYEALYGVRPFAGAKMADLADHIARGAVQPPPPAARVPSWLRRIVLRGLSASPSGRFPTMRALLDAIDAGLARSRRVAVAGAALLAAGALVVLLAFARAGGRGGAVTGAPSASARPVTLTDAPPPASHNAEALHVYARALQRLRDGTLAADDLEHATELDPTFAAAHLLYALTEFWEYPLQAREHLTRAVDGRDTLSERDRALLAGAQAWMQSPIADHEAYARVLTEAEARFPLDAEVAYFAGIAKDEHGDRAGALASYDRALAIDPAYGGAYHVKGDILAYLGAFPKALDVLAECVRRVPTSTGCLAERVLIDEQVGNCQDMEEGAQALLARDPSNPIAYWFLALASYSLGQPLDVARELLRQRTLRMTPSIRPRFELADLFVLDVLAGDLDGARARGRALEASIGENADRRLHARAALYWANASFESGRTAEAAEGASAFLRRKDAWVAEPRAEDFALYRDPTPRLLLAARRGGLLSPDEFERERAAWVESWKNRVIPSVKSFVWLHGYAAVAETREDAERALAEQPKFGPVPEFTPYVPGAAFVGTTYWLAGRTEEALPYLRRAAGACAAVESPIEHTQAHLVLGQALAATGARAEACAAYGVVIGRWGKATPKSVTAEKARSLAQALSCP